MPKPELTYLHKLLTDGGKRHEIVQQLSSKFNLEPHKANWMLKHYLQSLQKKSTKIIQQEDFITIK